jgi:dTDP-4-dehydrorhamnose 3,5-epimerase
VPLFEHMKKTDTHIPGLCVIEPRVFEDERGHFFELYSAEKLAALGIDGNVKQINQSSSKKGVLRGLHFQTPPHDQTKLVRCSKGRLYDAVVDIREGSPTYGKWFGIELSEENKKMLYVPSGFAHGFCALTDGAELQYMVGKTSYVKEAEGGLRYDDPSVGIQWPLDAAPLVNERDRTFPLLHELASPFKFSQETVVA